MTPCETAAGLLPDFWQDCLSAPERAADRLWLHQHLESCAECAGLASFWTRLGELPAAAPDPRQRQRFDQMLAAYQQGMEAAPRAAQRTPRHSWFAALAWRPLPAMAAAALLLVGLAAGWLVRGVTGAATAAQSGQEMADLRQQVQTTEQLAVLSLMQQSSANDRLQGVSYSNQLPGADPQVQAALVRSLKYDPSPDVRLAALDALARHAAEPDIQRQLVDSFHYQQSPLVQIALVDSFVETRDRLARSLLEQVSHDKTYNPEVRQRAAWGLAQPTWN